MVDKGKSEVRSPKSEVGPHSSFLVLLSSLFILLLILGCPGEDLTPPEVAIISPADADSIAGTTTIRARATDNTRVAYVDYYVDLVRVGADSVPAGPIFDYDWNPVGLAPGTNHALRCIAVDAAGNRNTSSTITVRIAYAAGTHHSGTITTNETWTYAAGPHIIDADLAVEAYLTIQPGVTVFIADNAAIAVGTRGPAGMKAQGRNDSAITFTALNPSSGPGAWRGIHYYANAVPDSNSLSHCTIQYAGAGAGALIQADAGATQIDSCTLSSSSGRGIAATGDGLRRLANTTITRCAGYPVSIPADRVSAIAAGNTFTDNSPNAIQLTGGTVTHSDTWPNLGFPYHITATITIADSANPLITIAPGCSLLFGDSAGLRVGVAQPGGLKADGSYGRITFAPIMPGPGNWRGLEFWEKTDPDHTILNYCRIEGAGADDAPAITSSLVPVTITSTTITTCAADGIYAYNTGLARLENDTITACAGFPLHIAAQYITTIGNGNSFAGNGQDRIEVTGGTITRDAQYRRQDVPYLITGMVEVGSQYEPSLVIDPGVELQFGHGAGLSIGLGATGRLLAIGVPDSIIFTRASPDTGTWRGLDLNRHASNQSRLDHCRLLYGGGDNHKGILFIDSCLATIANNEIAWSGNYCIYLVDRDTTLDPDTLRKYNRLHDWAPGDTDIYNEPPAPKYMPARGIRAGVIR